MKRPKIPSDPRFYLVLLVINNSIDLFSDSDHVNEFTVLINNDSTGLDKINF